MDRLKKFIFTFGPNSPIQPYKGGWVDIIAPNISLACQVFIDKYPRVDGLIPCSCVYYEDDFRATDMYTEGNYGRYWQETLVYDESRILKTRDYYAWHIRTDPDADFAPATHFSKIQRNVLKPGDSAKVYISDPCIIKGRKDNVEFTEFGEYIHEIFDDGSEEGSWASYSDDMLYSPERVMAWAYIEPLDSLLGQYEEDKHGKLK